MNKFSWFVRRLAGLRKLTFRPAEDGVLRGGIRCFAPRKACFCAAKGGVLANCRHDVAPCMMKIGGLIGVFPFRRFLFCGFMLSKFLNFTDACLCTAVHKHAFSGQAVGRAARGLRPWRLPCAAVWRRGKPRPHGLDACFCGRPCRAPPLLAARRGTVFTAVFAPEVKMRLGFCCKIKFFQIFFIKSDTILENLDYFCTLDIAPRWPGACPGADGRAFHGAGLVYET